MDRQLVAARREGAVTDEVYLSVRPYMTRLERLEFRHELEAAREAVRDDGGVRRIEIRFIETSGRDVFRPYVMGTEL
jgi:hypothetical protein